MQGATRTGAEFTGVNEHRKRRRDAADGARSRLTPVRTCVGCRQRAPQAQLLRVALVASRPVADPKRRLHGRGGYVHPVKTCVAKATTQGGFARAFRTRLVPPVELANAESLVVDGRGREEDRS